MISAIEEGLAGVATLDEAEAWREDVVIRKKRTPYAWAQAERWIGQGASPLSQSGPIKYNCDIMPWCKEPMIEAVSPEVQITVLWWASGMAKTEVVANIIGHAIDDEPKNIFVAYPKDASRDKFSRDVIDRMLESTPRLAALVPHKKSREAGNTIQYKSFPGGSIYMVGAGSASNFRGPRAGLIYCDEIDSFIENLDGEGDPVFLAFRRAEGFANAVKILSGTGTIASTIGQNGEKVYRSRIQYWYEQSDQRKWFVPCRSCGHLQFLKIDQIKAVKDKPWKSYIVCEKCDTAHDDKQRIAMVHRGKWIATAPFKGIRGYWLNGYNSTLPAGKGFKNKLHEIVEDAERARKDPNALRVWTMTVDTTLVNPEEEGEPSPNYAVLMERREDYNDGNQLSVPRGALVVTAAVDCHKNRLEIEWEGWGRNEENWGLDYVVIPGEIQDEAIWKELERELQREFKNESGAVLKLDFGLVDAGKWPDWVYGFLRRLSKVGSPIRGKIRACRGASVSPHPIIDTRYTSLARNLKGHWIGGDAAKDLIYMRCRMPLNEDGTFPLGWIHFPKSYEETYFQMLTAERVTIEYVRGEEIRRYKNPQHLRNEALDLRVYNLGAFRLRRWNFDLIERDLEEQLKKDMQPKKEKAVQPRMTPKRTGWMDGMKL